MQVNGYLGRDLLQEVAGNCLIGIDPITDLLYSC
jgi:hypothetical protein